MNHKFPPPVTFFINLRSRDFTGTTGFRTLSLHHFLLICVIALL